MIQWCDDFGTYGTNASLLTNGAYAQAESAILRNDIDPNAPIKPVLVLSFNNNNGNVRRVLSSPQTTVGVCVRIWPIQLPSTGATTFLTLNDSNNVGNVSFSYDTTGTLKVYRGDLRAPGAVLLGSSAGPVIIANSYQHIEVKTFFSETLGTVEVRVNGVTVVSLTNQDTVFAGIESCSQVVLTNTIFQTEIYFKDFVIWDGTGSLNNNFLGSVSVISLLPDGDDNLSWGLSSGSTAFNLINEASPNDLTFISAGSSPIPGNQRVSLSNLPANVTTVRGLMTFTRARKTDGGDANLQVGVVSGASTNPGTSKPVNTAYVYFNEVIETDPATGNPWTPLAVNNVLMRFNRTL